MNQKKYNESEYEAKRIIDELHRKSCRDCVLYAAGMYAVMDVFIMIISFSAAFIMKSMPLSGFMITSSALLILILLQVYKIVSSLKTIKENPELFDLNRLFFF